MKNSTLCFTFTSLLLLVRGVIAPFSPEALRAQNRIEIMSEEYDEALTPTPTAASTQEPLPFFVDEEANVTSQLGQDVFLHCRVEMLGNKTISWLRRTGSELHLLSVGKLTYSADSRYALSLQWPTDWRLKIRYVSERDEGWYECQLSTHPPLARRTYLHVIVPEVSIVDERGDKISEKLYKEGSIISLRCLAIKTEAPTNKIGWKHGGRWLSSDPRRGGISVKTEPIDGGALSRLYIANANRQDSGNYTCSLDNIAWSHVAVHVLKGENPQAMQRGAAWNSQPIHLTVTMSIIS